ncbi:MAG: hypothetical protein KJZ78_12815 [Bryobacteraceae bacterium]|nr:hypothetical protein [Bryobacteraceae bacterium]
MEQLNESYCYDAHANRAVVARANLHTLIPRVSTCTAAEVSALYPGNRLAATTYDLGGAMLWDGKSAFVVDGEDRLVRSTPVFPGGATPTEYEYDGEGRRVVKRTGAARVVYVYDAMGQLAAEYGGTNDLPGVGPHYLHTDALGSTRLVTDSAGAAQKRADYWPFGLEKNALVAETAYRTVGLKYGAGVDPALRFTGKERDSETGLDYFETRYFGSAQGRFTSPDGMIMKREWLSDPQRWNHYAYVRNNPLRFVDPNGEDLIVVYSTAELNRENLEWFRKNRTKIEAAVREKFKKAGIDNVTFTDRASLTKAQMAKLAALPVETKQNRPETFMPGLAQLNYLNDVSVNGKDMKTGKGDTTAFGMTNSGRAEVFLTNIGTTGCGGACAVANVTAHELGHTLGLESPGHIPDWSFGEFLRTVVGGQPFDVMASGNHHPVDGPAYFRTDYGKNERILKEVNRVKPIF